MSSSSKHEISRYDEIIKKLTNIEKLLKERKKKKDNFHKHNKIGVNELCKLDEFMKENPRDTFIEVHGDTSAFNITQLDFGENKIRIPTINNK